MTVSKSKLTLATLLCCVTVAVSPMTFSISKAQPDTLPGSVQSSTAGPVSLLRIGNWSSSTYRKGVGEASYGKAQMPNSQRREGLYSVQLTSSLGKVSVNLPDDLTAGETISGTVSISPEGENEGEKASSANALNDHFLDFAGVLVPVGSKRFKFSVPAIENDRKSFLLLLDKNRREIDRKELAVGSRRAAPRDSFDFPSVIEQGRPFEIRGPFDGDLANTRTTVGDAEVELLAESPGKLVARNTTKATGPATVQVNEQGIVIESSVRTLAVSLSAPKLNLLRGEQTTLSIRVRGLAGIKQPTPLLLENESSDVVSLSGGERQTFEINPRGQEANDSFSTQRVLTGIKPGGFTISVRVDVRFLDLWLKEVPDEEGWFDNATGSFRRGRQLADEASDARNRSEEGATQTAEEALRELDRARTYVRRALEAGEISESTAKNLEEYIAQYESQARRAKEQPPREVIVVSAPTPTPPSRPSPTPTATVTEGRFAPSQGVWQDDDVFEDKPGKRLTRIGPASWDAELKMVANRRTLLFGIRDDRRVRILIRGTTNGTRLVRVKFRFTLFEGGKPRVIYEEKRAENSVRLDGPIGPVEPFEASLLSSQGIPDSEPFTIDRPGPYRIEAELVRENGSPTGLKATVRGETVETQAPSFRIVPVLLSDPISQSVELEKQAKYIDLSTFLMDQYLPLKHNTIKSSADPTYDMRSLEPGTFDSLVAKVPYFTADIQTVRRDRIDAAIGQRFGTASSLTGGEKIAVLLSKKDFGLTIGEAFAYALSQKVIVIQPGTRHYTVAHEFIHTTPFRWEETQMEHECSRNYHNFADNKYGNGVAIHPYDRLRMNRVHAVMGPANYRRGEDTWITQCSYWHLLNYLVKSPDPDLLLVRGYLARSDQTVAGSFDKFYELRGDADLSKGQRSAEGFAVVLRDRANRVLAEYPFTAVWRNPDLERDRTVIPFTYRVETFPETYRVELVGPTGVLDSKIMSSHSPEIKIVTPVAGSRVRPTTAGLPVTWRPTDVDGDALSYSVYYSPNGGRNWRLVSYEQSGTSFVVPIRGRPRAARLRVIATDGTRSSVDEVGFSFER